MKLCPFHPSYSWAGGENLWLYSSVFFKFFSSSFCTGGLLDFQLRYLWNIHAQLPFADGKRQIRKLPFADGKYLLLLKSPFFAQKWQILAKQQILSTLIQKSDL